MESTSVLVCVALQWRKRFFLSALALERSLEHLIQVLQASSGPNEGYVY